MSAPITSATSHGSLDIETILLLAFQWIIFVGNIALYFTDPLPIWVHMIVAVVPVHVAFTIWHEAAHGNVSKNRLTNRVVGILGMFPYMTPFFLQRYVHLDHHKYLNQKGADPNLIYADGPFWQLPFRYVRAMAYAREKLANDPRSPGMRLSDNIGLGVLAAIWGVAILTGHFVDLLLIWFVPLVVGKVVMDWYVNYLPHVGLPPHRFLGTRILDVHWLTPLLLSHNYHAIHHLWPSIPWHRYLATYREKRGYLVERHVPIEDRLFGPRSIPEMATESGPRGS